MAKKIAVLSDIHSNLTALRAVLRACERVGIAQFYCLGDIVGYGPHPAECLRLIRQLPDCLTVLGNHDDCVARGRVALGLNAYAAEGVRYSIRQLGKAERAWLRALPLILEPDRATTIVHASLWQPKAWHYILGGQDAKRSFVHQTTPICFFGHTHRSTLFAVAGAGASATPPEQIGRMKFRFHRAGRYMINPGSVGQPRGGDPRAHYVIYDRDELTVELCRVKYDIADEIRDFEKAGLPALLGERLLVGM